MVGGGTTSASGSKPSWPTEGSCCSSGCAEHPPLAPSNWPVQVRRSKDNPLGYSDDELTKRVIDLKEW